MGLWQDVQEFADVKDIWVIAVEVCSTQGCIAASMANSSAFLPALLAVDPLHTDAVDRPLIEVFPSNPRACAFTLPQVDPLVRTLCCFWHSCWLL